MKFIILFLFLTHLLAAKSDHAPLTDLGVSIVKGYRNGDASSFREIAHPQLIQKIRKLMKDRLGSDYSFAPPSVVTAEAITSLPDVEVVDYFVRFVTKMTAFVPEVSAEWTYPKAEISVDGDKATIHVTEHVEALNRKTGKRISNTSIREIEFRKVDGQWRYLAGPGTRIHLDMPLGIYE